MGHVLCSVVANIMDISEYVIMHLHSAVCSPHITIKHKFEILCVMANFWDVSGFDHMCQVAGNNEVIIELCWQLTLNHHHLLHRMSCEQENCSFVITP